MYVNGSIDEGFSALSIEKLQVIFNEFNLNGNGAMTFNEFCGFLSTIGR